MGGFRQQSAGSILHDYRDRQEAARERTRGIYSHDSGDREGFRSAMKLLRRIRYFLQQRRMERELAEELEFHRSLSGAAAMGNMTLAREDARAVWIWPWLQSVWQDLCYGIRGLLRQPGFTMPALFALGSAIGINASL